jgi:hypothetical protein
LYTVNRVTPAERAIASSENEAMPCSSRRKPIAARMTSLLFSAAAAARVGLT